VSSWGFSLWKNKLSLHPLLPEERVKGDEEEIKWRRKKNP
jgi:hypothetical protein